VTVSKLTRDLDEAVRQFHQAQLSDDYAYLFLDGVSLRVRRPAGRKRVHMLVAYAVRRDGTRHQRFNLEWKTRTLLLFTQAA
jgi:transposase-like protein